MKNCFLIFGLCLLATGLTLKSSRAQQPAPVNFVVFEEFVKPADWPAYREVQQKAVDLWKKHNLDVPVYTYQTDESSVYWVIPMQSFASLDNIFGKFEAMTQKMKTEDGFDGQAAFRDLSSTTASVIMWSPDLSFHADGRFGQSAEKPYCEWSFCNIKSGHEKEAGEAIKKYIEFYKKTGEKYDWDLYYVLLGQEMPVWILMTTSDSPVTLRQLETDLDKKYSKEFGAMWTEFTKHVNKIETKTGWFMPKWSLTLPQ